MTVLDATVTPGLERGPCPRCKELSLDPDTHAEQVCPLCNWRGRVLRFNPRPLTLDRPEAALPEDVTCAFHPTKRATAVCEGTGSYICPLCAVEIAGATYSAEFINSGGLKDFKKHDAFNRRLKRPDYCIYTFVVLSIFPYTAFLAPLWFVLDGSAPPCS